MKKLLVLLFALPLVANAQRTIFDTGSLRNGSVKTNHLDSTLYGLVTAGGVPTINDGSLTTNKIDSTFHGLLTTPNFTGVSLTVNGNNPDGTPAAIRGTVNQSANIFEVQSSNNTTLFGVGPTGAVTASLFSGPLAWSSLTDVPSGVSTNVPTLFDEHIANYSHPPTASQLSVYQDFALSADTSAGTVPDPQYGDAWDLRPSGANPGATIARVLDGKLITGESSVLYASQSFDQEQDFAGAEIEFYDAGGTSENAVFNISWSTRASGSWIDDLIHLNVERKFATIEVGFFGSRAGMVRLGKIFYDEIPTNTVVKVNASISGNRLTLNVGKNELTVVDPTIQRVFGKHIYWEIYQPSASYKALVAIRKVWAGTRIESQPAQVVSTPTESSLVFDGSTNAYGISTLTNLTEIGTGPFTVALKFAVPSMAGQSSAQRGLFGIITNSAGTMTSSSALVMSYSAANLDIGCWETNQGTSRRYPIAQFAGKDLVVVFTRGTSGIECFLNGIPSTPTVVITGVGASANYDLKSRYAILGKDYTATHSSWNGNIYWAGVFNCSVEPAIFGEFTKYPSKALSPTTGATLNSGTLISGRTYRIVASQSNHFYTGSAAGDRIYVADNTYFVDVNSGTVLTTISNALDANNTVVQEGHLLWLDGTTGTGTAITDRSNWNDAVVTGTITHSLPLTVAAGGLSEEDASLLYQGTNSYLTDIADGTATLVELTATTLNATTYNVSTQNVGTLNITNNVAITYGTSVSNVVDFLKAESLINVGGNITYTHATNGAAGQSITHIVTMPNWSGTTRTLTIPAGWRTNFFSPVPPSLTNGTITTMYVRAINATGDAANQTNVMVSFDHSK